METVEVVIKIPKKYKDYIKYSTGILPDKIIQYLFNALDNGIVLPKGHGRLIDAEQLMNYCQNQIDGHKYADCNVIARFPIVLGAEEKGIKGESIYHDNNM